MHYPLSHRQGNAVPELAGSSLAVDQATRSLELRAAMSLVRLWEIQGKEEQAYQLLQPVHSCFIEGFETADLIAARRLLKLE